MRAPDCRGWGRSPLHRPLSTGTRAAGTSSYPVGACAGRESVPEDRWPSAQLLLATLHDDDSDIDGERHEPMFEK
jgi:hypothetical protein